MEETRNLGVMILSQPESPPGLIIVTGTGRCGTTCVAVLLRDLGVSMSCTIGRDHGEMFAENLSLNAAITRRDSGRLDRIASEMGEGLWGFKAPGEFANIVFAAKHLKHLNPCIIVICRDSIASASCEINFQARVNGMTSKTEWIKTFTQRNFRVLSEALVHSKSTPMMMISFEKLLENPAGVTKEICGFTGVSFSESAVSVIGKNSSYYKYFR